MRRRLQVQHRFRTYRIDKADVPAFHAVLGSLKVDLAFDDVGAPDDDRFCRSPSQAQIRIPGKTQNRALHLQLRRGFDMHIQPNPVEQRIGRRQGRNLRAAFEVSPEVEARSHRQLVNRDLPRKRRSPRRADEVQIRIRAGADAWRIAQANIFPQNTEIEVDLPVAGRRITGEGNQPASGSRGESFDLQPILIEDK